MSYKPGQRVRIRHDATLPGLQTDPSTFRGLLGVVVDDPPVEDFDVRVKLDRRSDHPPFSFYEHELEPIPGESIPHDRHHNRHVVNVRARPPRERD